MFKIPEWEEDIPKNNISFSKNTPKKNKQNAAKKKSPSKPNNSTIKKSKQNGFNNKYETEKNKLNFHNEITKKAKKRKAKIDIKTLDTEKIDEVLINSKKKKFHEDILEENGEADLFKVKSPSPVKKNNKPTLKLDIKHSRLKMKQSKLLKKAKVNQNTTDRTIFKVPNNEINDANNDEDENNLDNGTIEIKNNTQNKIKKVKEVIVQPVNRKKEKLKNILNSNRNTINVNSNKLRERMLERLKAAQFRYLNEKLYTSSGNEAKELFESDPQAFRTYHQGYQQQIKKWPVNPLDLVVRRIMKMPKTHVIADMGCGEAALSRRIPHSVRSFDLVATTEGVEVCDMARTPLVSGTIDVAVYCLALMGTELTQYLLEANRILKINGHLLIAEVESRFDDVDGFTKTVSQLGFKLKHLDKSHQVFYFMEFIKIRDSPVKKSKLPVLTLKPCLYKKR